MISINADKKLNIILPNTNKALNKVLIDASPKELEIISKGKDLKSIISSLLKESSQDSTADKALLSLAKNNPTLKDLGAATQNLKDLLNTLKSDKNLLHVEKMLENFLPDIKDVKNTDVKTTLNNSGIFLESKLKNIVKELSSQENIKEILNNDLKATLHKASEEMSKVQSPVQGEITKHIDKLLLQIDYYQLVSHLSNASSLYIPFSWDEMQDGNINIKHSKDDKFYCDIELKLKEYGELNVRLALYEKNQLNININSDNEEFKKILKEAIPELRRALIDAQITPREIRLHKKTKEVAYDAYNDISKDLDIGFEVLG